MTRFAAGFALGAAVVVVGTVWLVLLDTARTGGRG